jgi:hypothetical protein
VAAGPRERLRRLLVSILMQVTIASSLGYEIHGGMALQITAV